MRPACLKSPKVAAFADYWHELRGASTQDIPSLVEYPLEIFGAFLPNLAVTRRRQDGNPYYHFYGTELAKEFGHDLTGKDVIADMTEEAKEQFLQSVANADALEKDGTWINGRWFIGEMVTKDGRTVELEGVTLPFFAKGGEVRRATYSTVVGGVALGDALGGHYPKTELTQFNALDERPAWMHLKADVTAAE